MKMYQNDPKGLKMRVYSTINYSSSTPCVVALGCFDGVHLGHKTVIEQALDIAKRSNCDCAVWTFDEPPKNYFLSRAVPLITDAAQKRKLIAKLGVDKFISVPFTKETAKISAEDFFFDILKKRIKAIHIVCGFNYSFGSGGKGNVDLLRRLCEETNTGLTVLSPVSVSGVTVSSSSIRDALLSGDPETAARLLGRPFSLKTIVISGQRLARKLGFPTVNQEFSSGGLVPQYGVYATRVYISNRKKPYYGITNVGIRPTVGGTAVFAETHIFELSENLYGKAVKVEFLHFIRDEQKFDGLEALTAQINKDIESAKKYISEL